MVSPDVVMKGLEELKAAQKIRSAPHWVHLYARSQHVST